MKQEQPFSRNWLIFSVVIFMVFEIVIGGWLAQVLVGKRISHMLSLRIELILSLGSFFLGGLVVGLISPGRRLMEPAIAAAISVVLTFMISFFTPLMFVQASVSRMLIGGAVAFIVALWGADLGERLTESWSKRKTRG